MTWSEISYNTQAKSYVSDSNLYFTNSAILTASLSAIMISSDCCKPNMNTHTLAKSNEAKESYL